MRKQALAYLCIALVWINACGRNEMTESLALDTLADLPMSSGTMAGTFSDTTEVTYENLGGLIQHLVDSGQVELRGSARMAVSSNSQVDMQALTDLLALIQNQNGKPSVLKLASGMLALNAGSPTASNDKLTAILALITQLAPLISAIAPQFAPILKAITTLIPLVIQIINLFKKPAAAFDGVLRAVTA